MRTSLYILGDLAEEDIVFLSKSGELRDFASGDVLVRKGETPDAIFFITRGGFDVLTPGGERVARLTVGDVIGEMSFVEERPPNTNVLAYEAARVLAVPKPAIDAALAENPAFAGRFFKALATFLSDRLRRATAENEGRDRDSVELDERLLDLVHVAGDRMHRLIALLEGHERL